MNAPAKVNRHIAIYPGSFDPVTYGHIDLIKRATHIFDKVIIAVAKNSRKKLLFDVNERLEMLRRSVKDIERVEVDSFEGLVIKYARERNVRVLIRGLRMISDFEYEFQMALTNRRLAQDVEVVFLMPSEKYSFLSSTLLKEAGALGADLSSFVPSFIEKKLKGTIEAVKIFIRDISANGLAIKRSIEASEIDLVDDSFTCLSPLAIQANMEKVDGEVLAEVKVTAAYQFFCGRCLAPVRREQTENLNLNFEIDPTKEFIDLGEEIRQEMIVANSKIVFCREDCKGICPGCGVDLNKESCKCNTAKQR